MKSVYKFCHLPPSVNSIWRHAKGGKTYKTSEYVTWQNSEGYNLNPQIARQCKFTGPVFVTGALRRPTKNSDLDNRLKGIGDILATLGAIENDKHIMGWNVFWSDDLPVGVAAEISIVDADAVSARRAA